MSRFEQLASLAAGAARAAGKELLRRYGVVSGVGHKSSATDPVSDADRAAERIIVEMLVAARPDDGIVGEEGAARPTRSGVRWIVDPLDGTVNYLYGLPAWCVSVACADADEVVVGAVYDPLADELFSAVRGQGAWLGDRRLAVNDPVDLDRALVATGFAYDAAHRRRQAAVVAALLPDVRDIRRAGSAALDLCAVAAGRVDGYYEDSTALWDWAAGALLVREAGGVTSPLAGANGQTGLVAAGPALHSALEAAVTPAR